MKYKEIKKDRELREYIARGNEKLGVMGYTDHSEKHCILVAERAGMILKKFEYPEPYDRVGKDRRLYARYRQLRQPEPPRGIWSTACQ